MDIISNYNTKGVCKKSGNDTKTFEEYFKEFNIYNKFISNNLIVQDNRIDSKIFLLIKDVFPIFTKWYKRLL